MIAHKRNVLEPRDARGNTSVVRAQEVLRFFTRVNFELGRFERKA